MFILNICNNQTIKNIHAAAIINSEIAASNAHYAYMYSYNIIGDNFELIHGYPLEVAARLYRDW